MFSNNCIIKYFQSLGSKNQNNEQKFIEFEVKQKSNNSKPIDGYLKDMKTDPNQEVVEKIVDIQELNDNEGLDSSEPIDSYQHNHKVFDQNELIQRNHNFRRDSFDDRICDDLCRVLLCYLKFEDKFRFECISQQWKDLIFSHKYVINDWIQILDNEKGIFFSSKDIKCKFNSKAFKKVLMKLSDFGQIGYCIKDNDPPLGTFCDKLKDFYQKIKYYRNLRYHFRLIIENCPQMKTIKMDFYPFLLLDNKLIELFGRKFGQSLVNLEMREYMRSDCKQTLIRLCPNLVSVKGFDLKDFMIGNDFIIFKKLTKVYLFIDDQTVEHLFEGFVKVYENQLKSLTFDSHESNDLDCFQLYSSFLSFKNLTEFQLFESVEIDNELSDLIQKMGLKCKRLKKLSLDMFWDDIESERILWESLRSLKQLTQITLGLYTIIGPEELDSIQCLKFESIINNNIKKLNLTSNKYIHLANDLPPEVRLELCFDNIENCFPNLQILTINPYHFIINNNTFKSLSKLKNLRKFSFSGKSNFTSEGVLDLINGDNNLFYIIIDSEFEITQTLIDGFKALVLRKPKVLFELYLNFDKNDYKSEFDAIQSIHCLASHGFVKIVI